MPRSTRFLGIDRSGRTLSSARLILISIRAIFIPKTDHRVRSFFNRRNLCDTTSVGDTQPAFLPFEFNAEANRQGK